MREIKFRAWDKRGNFMYLVREMFWLNKGLTVDDGATIREAIVGDNTELMQYTGLKDKNGKEIYDGDIICLHNINCPAEIIWNDKEACFACNWLSAETRRIRKEVGMPYLPGNLTSSGNPWEVIGNIHENKELLGRNKK